MTTILPNHRTASGLPVKAGPAVARGGEGVLATVAGRPDVLVKYWHRDIERERDSLEDVIRATAGGWPSAQHPQVAAPLEVVFDEADRAVGVLLARLPSSVVPLTEAISPQARASFGLDVSRRWRLRVAARLAGIVARAHDAGLVLADLGPHNLAVDLRRGRITAFDVDAWQPAEGARPRRVGGDVATPELLSGLAPEPTIAGDRFALALSIVLILADGRHPFDGVPADGSRSHATVDDNLATGHSHFSSTRPLRPVAGAARIGQLPPRLRPLVIASIVDGHADRAARPPASVWVSALRAEEARR
jgi:DNA-binding helix-hairpin-helix protein with protein kinase domain